MADLTSEEVQAYSDGQLKWIVANGIRLTGMPGWEDIIDETTQWRIVYYMRALADQEKAQRFEAVLKDREKWEVAAPGGADHHHAEEQAVESAEKQPEHVHEEPDEHGHQGDHH